MKQKGTALVTGASSGLGEAFASALARKGYDLVLVARRRELLEELAAEIRSSCGVKAEVLTADLAVEQEAAGVAAFIESRDDVSMLVNNAGYAVEGPFAQSDIERQLDMVRVHDLATMRLTRAALPGMVTRCGGAVINVSSLGAFAPLGDNSVYTASKSFLVLFTETLHLELMGTGVRVQVLCPGFTHTGFHKASGSDVSAVPGWMWMDVDNVVEESLRALEQGRVVVIPGKRNRIFRFFFRLPRPVLYRVQLRVLEMSERRRVR